MLSSVIPAAHKLHRLEHQHVNSSCSAFLGSAFHLQTPAVSERGKLGRRESWQVAIQSMVVCRHKADKLLLLQYCLQLNQQGNTRIHFCRASSVTKYSSRRWDAQRSTVVRMSVLRTGCSTSLTVESVRQHIALHDMQHAWHLYDKLQA